MLSIVIAEERLEAALAGGALACPECSGPLSPCGFARSREVRLLHGTRSVTPRRALRRVRDDPRAVPGLVGPAPARRGGGDRAGAPAGVGGVGHRRIARPLGRPAGKVRGWLRAARSRAEELRACASRRLVSLDCELGVLTPGRQRSERRGRGDDARCPRVRASVRSRRGRPWERAVCLTGGLLYGRPLLPP